jgi:diguanylate cyclase (GGDEF)-like protein
MPSRWLSRQLLRLGRARALLAVTAASVVLAAGAAALTLLLARYASPMLAVLGACLCAAVLAPAISAFVLPLLFELERTRRHLGRLTTQDDLTGVHNRRHFMEIAEREWARCRRYDTPAALLLVDADHFRRINDRHGHLGGDALLREITRLTAESLRQPDVLARFGGEELIVFLPHADPLGALDVAERIRERISLLKMPWQGVDVQTTVSIGVAALGAGHASLDALIHDADLALHAAKEAGRNCVRAAPIQPRRSGETHPVSTPR